MAKYKTFFNELISFLNCYDTEDIKTAIGDSTNNHRTATVSQVIRFLATRKSDDLRDLGNNLSLAYETLRDDLAITREDTNRSDAFDINEFVDTYNANVIVGKDTELRKSLGKHFIA